MEAELQAAMDRMNNAQNNAFQCKQRIDGIKEDMDSRARVKGK